jgi:hypothetical protein
MFPLGKEQEEIQTASYKGIFLSISPEISRKYILTFEVRHGGTLKLQVNANDAQNLEKANRAIAQGSAHEVLIKQIRNDRHVHGEIIFIH